MSNKMSVKQKRAPVVLTEMQIPYVIAAIASQRMSVGSPG